MRSVALILPLLLGAAACGSASTTDFDTGGSDAAERDTGLHDAGSADVGPDATARDVGLDADDAEPSDAVEDAGAPADAGGLDAAERDVGLLDASAPDATVVDGAAPDSGPEDAGAPDLGALDVGAFEDAGSASDTGAPEDGGAVVDAGSSEDAGPRDPCLELLLARSWYATAEFSVTDNPCGPWSYGWMTATATVPFTIYPDGIGSGWYDSAHQSLGAPSVWKNLSGSAAYGIPPGALGIHPGPNGERSSIRWTAPIAARCTYEAQYRPGDRADMSAHVLLAGRTVFEHATTEDSPRFAGTATVAVGETLDFAVGVLPGGSFYFGNTEIEIAIDCR